VALDEGLAMTDTDALVATVREALRRMRLPQFESALPALDALAAELATTKLALQTAERAMIVDMQHRKADEAELERVKAENKDMALHRPTERDLFEVQAELERVKDERDAAMDRFDAFLKSTTQEITTRQDRLDKALAALRRIEEVAPDDLKANLARRAIAEIEGEA
jgi:hypothetical protein